MADARDTHLLVIGGGPGGYPAALHAADHGLNVTLVDQDPKLGGVCLNRGCIPSKALLHAAKMHPRGQAKRPNWGLTFGEPQARPRQDARVRPDRKSSANSPAASAMLCKGRGVETDEGPCRPSSMPDTRGEVTGEKRRKRSRFEKCIIASGRSCRPSPRPSRSATTASWIQHRRPSVAGRSQDASSSIGGGYIGLEIGSVYAALGTAR